MITAFCLIVVSVIVFKGCIDESGGDTSITISAFSINEGLSAAGKV